MATIENNRPQDTTTTSDREETLNNRVILTPEEREAAVAQARNSNLDDELFYVAAEYAKTESTTDFQPSNNFIQVEGDRLLIQAVASGDIETLVADLEKLGVTEISTYKNVAAGYINIVQLGNLGGLNSLNFAQPAYKGFTRKGSVTSQGDKAMGSDVAKTNLEVDGTGIKVGVISDSFNNLNGQAADVTSGDLPENVTIVKDLESGGSDEGRAMAQIVHDVAPGSELLFRTAFISAVDFANGIGELVSAGADVIVDDIYYLDQPFFQDGIIAQAATDAVNAGVAYFSAAGNSGTDSYESGFNAGNQYPSGFFPGGFFGGVAHDFDGTGDELQEFILESGERIWLSFQWTDPFASAGGSGATRDLDIYILNAEGTEILASSANQNVGKDAVEVLSFVNDSEESQTYNLMIVHNTNLDGGQSHPRLIKYIDFDGQAEFTEYTTNSPTIFGHPNAEGVVAVGAANYQKTPAFGEEKPLLEDFSSVGGIPVLVVQDNGDFAVDQNGNFITETRQTPWIVAPDGADTTFFGSPDGDQSGFPDFFGTSAAAPHAAGVAALMLQAAGGTNLLTPEEIKQALADTAIDMEEEGVDFKSGNGFINAENAIFAVKPDIILTSEDDNKVVGGQSSEYQIKLNTQPSADVTINFVVDTGKIAQIAPVTFTPENWNSEQTITITATQVTGNDATIIQPTVTSNDPQYAAANLDDLIVTIIDNDSEGVSIFRSNGSNDITEGGVTDTFQIVLNTEPTSNVIVNIAFDSNQVTLDQESVTFTPQNWNQKQTVTITAVDDKIAEGDHLSNIQFQINPNSDSEYLNIEIEPIPNSVNLPINIKDDDFAGVTIELNNNLNNSQETLDITENGLISTYQTKLNSQPTQTVTIDLTNDAQIELLKVDQDTETVINSLTFTPNTWDTFQTITVRAIDDEAIENLHTSVIKHTINTENTLASEYLEVKIGDTNINIVDNETVGVTIIPTANLSVTENGEDGENSTTYKVILNQEPTANVTLNLTPLTDNQGLNLDKTNLTFTPQNYNQFQTVTVTGINDNIARGDRTEEIKYTVNSNSAPEYRNITVDSVKVDVKDDDKIGLEIIKNADTVTVSEDGTTATYDLKLKSQPTENVFIEFETGDQLNSIIPVTFTPENWDTEQTITVSAIDDNLVEDNPALTVIKHFARSESAAEYLALPQTNISVQVNDNDEPGVIITETEGNTTVIKGKQTDTYSISLNSRPQNPVTINITTDNQLQNINSVTFTGFNWNQPQTITVVPINNTSSGDSQSIIKHEISSSSDGAFLNATIDDVTVNIENDPNAGLFPNNSDLNNDGINDSEQSNIESIAIPENSTSFDDVLTVVTPEDSIINILDLISNPGANVSTNPENNGVNFPLEFLDLKVINLKSGADGIISLLLPDSADNQNFNTYWLYQPTSSNNRDHWENFLYSNGLGAKFFDTDNNGNPDLILLSFIEGQNGDADLTANGEFTHKSGLGVASSDLTLTRDNNKIFSFESDTPQTAYLNFSRVSSNSDDLTEIGVFVVDSDNNVNGVAPTESGFLDAALGSATVIFSSLDRESQGVVAGLESSRKLQFNSGDRLGFYVIKNNTTDDILQGRGNSNNVFFSLTEANFDSFSHINIIDNGTNQYTLRWETSTAGDDLSFDDLVINIQLQDAAPNLQQLIANPQGDAQSELIDLTNVPAQNVQATINTIRSEATLTNFGGVFQIEDAEGTIVDPLTGQTLTPGQSGYEELALQLSQTTGKGMYFSANGVGGVSENLEGGKLYTPFIFVQENSELYLPFIASNSDGVDHTRLLGDNTFGFEDLPNGGDRDYDDLIFQVKFDII